MALLSDVNETLHSIEIVLRPNTLGRGEGAYIARAKSVEAPLTVEKICANAKARGGYEGSYDTLLECSHAFVRETIHSLLDNFPVSLDGYFSLHPHIAGTYNARDRIEGSKISVGIHELEKLRELFARVQVVNLGPAGDGAFIDEITDTKSGSLNHTLTPGGAIHITGTKIKVEGADPACGIFFRNKAGGAPVKVTENLVLNRAGEVIAIIPALPAGTYTVEIVTRFSRGSTELKEPRTIVAGPDLTVS